MAAQELAGGGVEAQLGLHRHDLGLADRSGLAAGFAIGRPDDTINVLGQAFSGQSFPGWGWGLGVVYAVWLAVLVILVPLSRWMAGLKRRRRDWWLGYV